MKKEIHPKYYPEAKVICACGNTWTTGSSKEVIRTEMCSTCHPFFTGEQRIVDTGGQVGRFERRLEKSGQLAAEIERRQGEKEAAQESLFELVAPEVQAEAKVAVAEAQPEVEAAAEVVAEAEVVEVAEAPLAVTIEEQVKAKPKRRRTKKAEVKEEAVAAVETAAEAEAPAKPKRRRTKKAAAEVKAEAAAAAEPAVEAEASAKPKRRRTKKAETADAEAAETSEG